MMRRRYLLPLLAALVMANCGGPKPKPPPVLTLTMIGSAEQNPDSDGKAQPEQVGRATARKVCYRRTA